MTSDLVEPFWATTLIMQPWQCQGPCLVGRAVCVGSGVLSTWTPPPSACVKSGTASNCSEEQYICLWWEGNTAHAMELLVRIRCNNTCKMPGTWWEVCRQMFHLIPLIFSQLSQLVTTHFYQRSLLSGTHCFLFWGGELKSSFKVTQSEGMRGRLLSLLSQSTSHNLSRVNEWKISTGLSHFGSYSVFKIGQLLKILHFTWAKLWMILSDREKGSIALEFPSLLLNTHPRLPHLLLRHG